MKTHSFSDILALDWRAWDGSRLAFLSIAIAASAYPQGTDLSTIRGTVTDISGGVIPNAKVRITDLETNLSRQLSTDSEGNYEASALKYGRYKVTITVPGFNTAEITDITLRTSDVIRADARLTPVGANEAVVITAEAPQLETEKPTDSRDIYSFLYLNPNITQGASDGAFKFIGAQTYGASFSLDGQRSNGGVFGEPTSRQPSLEAVGELVVLSNDFTAEYAAIANIRVETKRGANQFLGSAFYNNKNSALAAWDYRDKIAQAALLPTPEQSQYPNPFFNLNEIGGSFSGPVPKVKNTFFLMAYERRWSASPVNLHSTTLPGPRLWTGDFSQLSDSGNRWFRRRSRSRRQKWLIIRSAAWVSDSSVFRNG